jgi:hypothetical protein
MYIIETELSRDVTIDNAPELGTRDHTIIEAQQDA